MHNRYSKILVLPCSDDLYPELKKLSAEITKVALELGGTCTGEHGVGLGKRDALKVNIPLAQNSAYAQSPNIKIF